MSSCWRLAQHEKLSSSVTNISGAFIKTSITWNCNLQLQVWSYMLTCHRNAGAMQTIEKLLKKADTRSAAITMLGKTVELCVARIPECR